MEKSKLNPLQMVAREMAQHSDYAPFGEEDKIVRRLISVLDYLHDRAALQVQVSPDTPEALSFSEEYLAVCEVIAQFGTQLTAFEDIEMSSDERDSN